MPRKRLPKFPATLFVREDFDPNKPKALFFLAEQTGDGGEDGEHVGIYKLTEVRVMRITRKLGK